MVGLDPTIYAVPRRTIVVTHDRGGALFWPRGFMMWREKAGLIDLSRPWTTIRLEDIYEA